MAGFPPATDGAAASGTSVFVGNLSWEATNEDLASHFADAGTVVSAEVQFAPNNGRSKGFAIVTFASEAEALNAIDNWDRTEILGRAIQVREDRSNAVVAPPDGTTVFVGNLSWDATNEDLNTHFAGAGQIVKSEVMVAPNGRSKGCGTVKFGTTDEAQNAIDTLNETELLGRNIQVREDRAPPAKTPRQPRQPRQRNAGAAAGGGAPAAGGGRRKQPAYVDDGPKDGTKCFIGNLAWATTDDTLAAFFAQSGTVVSAEVMCAPNGRSKGCGIVKFGSAAEALRAIGDLNGMELDGRAVQVRQDRQNVDAPPPDGSCVFVGNLSWETTTEDLQAHMATAGQIVSAEVMVAPNGRSKGCGIVKFGSAAEAQNAIAQLNDTVLGERPIQVREDREPYRS